MKKKKQPSKPRKTSKKGSAKGKTLTEALSPYRWSLEQQLEERMENLEELCGGRQRLIEGLLATDDPRAKSFIRALGDAKNADLSLYQVCKKIQTSPDQILKIFTEGEMVRSTVLAFAQLHKELPAIMESQTELAQRPTNEGRKAAKEIFKIMGMYPESKGVAIKLNQNVKTVLPDNLMEQVVKTSSKLAQKNPFDEDPPDPDE